MNNMNNQGMPIQPMYPQFGNGMSMNNFNQFVPTTNKLFVVSLEDALSRPADYNSEIVYFDQNKDVMYNVCTNGRGEKNWTVFDVTISKNHSATPVNPMEKRLSDIESKLEELLNGQRNVKQTDTSNQ